NGRSVRLCVPAKEAVANYNCEYKIGDVWLIEKYTIPSRLIPPHTEDIYVHSKSWKRKAENTFEVIEKLMPPVIGGVDCLFDGSVQCAKDGRLHIAKSCVPQYSTLFWRPDRPLHLTFSSKGSSRYVYDTGVGKCFFSYVGTRTARSVL